MLGTASREIDRLRARRQRDDDRFDRLEDVLDSLSYSAPENREAALHSVVNVARQITTQRKADHEG